MRAGRFTADIEGDFVIFLIGAKITKWSAIRRWWPLATAMNKMQREIGDHPEIGCLHIENYGALSGVSIQYWRSFEHLERFARSSEWSHLEVWRAFNRVIKDSGDMGIWHETYLVPAGQYEAIYGNVPLMGLARASESPALKADSTAANRINVEDQGESPVEGY